jgi:hypothetical protein
MTDRNPIIPGFLYAVRGETAFERFDDQET